MTEYLSEKETARQERNTSRKKSEEERRKMMTENGIKFTVLTPKQIAANKRYDEEKDRRERMAEELELLNMEQIGEVSLLIFAGWLLIALAVIATLGSPIYEGVKSLILKKYKSAIPVSIFSALFIRFLVFIIRLSFWGIEFSDEANSSLDAVANASLALTVIMISVAVVAMLSAPLVERVKRIIQKDYRPVPLVLVIVVVMVRFLWFIGKLLFFGIYISEENSESTGLVSMLLLLTFVLVDLAIIGMIFYPLWEGVKRILEHDYKPSARVAVHSFALITFIVMSVKIFLSNGFGSASSEADSFWIDLSLILTYLMLGLVGVGMIGSEVFRFIKTRD